MKVTTLQSKINALKEQAEKLEKEIGLHKAPGWYPAETHAELSTVYKEISNLGEQLVLAKRAYLAR